MITLNNVTLRRGTRVLLENCQWTIFYKERFGIIGNNGAGKSSLFSLLLNELQPDNGEITIPAQIRLAHVAQETEARDDSAIDYVLDGDVDLRAIEAGLRLAEENNDGEKIGSLYEEMSNIDGYTARARAQQMLAGLGFTQAEQEKSVKEFSGGWRVRLNLARALMCRSSVLLLDEPTNHLDLDAVIWLEGWLQKYEGTLLIISHDRDFLDRTVNRIAHIYKQQLQIYSGNYSRFERARAEQLLLQQATYEKQQKQLAHMQSYVNRFRAQATKARQAQSRMKAIERMNLVCAVQTESQIQFEFRPPYKVPNPLLKLNYADVGYENKIIFKNLNISIAPQERIALLGPNGAGKSSLIKSLAGELILQDGEYQTSSGLKIGYFAQHQIDHLRLDETPIEHLQDLAKQKLESELRQYLGGFGFSGDRVFEPVGNFSGGEKSRLALALLIWQKPNLLLLDEPTNHLDLEMRNALSIALQGYEGAMLLVSHDRFLVRTTTDQLWLAHDGKLENYTGDLDDYQQWLTEYRRQQFKTPDAANVSRKKGRQQELMMQEAHKMLQQKIKKLEEKMVQYETKLAAAQEKLADLSIYHEENKNQLEAATLTEKECKVILIQCEEEWLSLQAQLEKGDFSA